jgi:DNA-directed RNA polymerase specialized sigma24 family protein
MISRDERIEKQEKLIKAARDGSEEAFIELENELRIPVVSKFRTWVKNAGDVNDLFKTTWLKVREEISLYDPELGTPLTFVLSIAEREARDLCLLGRKKELSIETIKAHLEEDKKAALRDKSPDKDPETRLTIKELSEQLNKFFMHLLGLTFEKGGYPNQIIAFMYSMVIFPSAERKNRRVSGYPGKVVSELFDIYLKELSLKLEIEYMKYSFLTEVQVSSVFRPLHRRINSLLTDILDEKQDSNTWDIIKQKGYLKETAGNTTMRHYCRIETGNSYLTDMVTNWCYKVKERVRKCFFDNQDLRKFFFSLVDNLELVSNLNFSSKKFRDLYSRTKI